MNSGVQQLLDHNPSGLWVDIDVAAEALNVSRRRAYELARQENWRTAGRHPKQYLFADITRTYRRRAQKGTR